jgi:hypothetical protein
VADKVNTAVGRELEYRLGLPVVTIQPGTIAILDKFARHAEFLNEEEASKLLGLAPAQMGGQARADVDLLLQNTKLSQYRSQRRKKKNLSLRLYLRYSNSSASVAVTTIEKITSATTKIQKIEIIIDTGPYPFDWDHVLKFIADLWRLRGKSQRIPTNIIIDGAFSCPDRHHMKGLVEMRAVFRYVLGSGLGYSGDLNGNDARKLVMMSDYGLRVPVLFYWSGEDHVVVEQLLKKALKLNKLSGVSVLPYFLSPYFDCRTMTLDVDGRAFSNVVNGLYGDRLLSEFLDEPISNLENRISDCFTTSYVCALIRDTGERIPFKVFPFATNGYDGRIRKDTEFLELLTRPRTLPIYKRCRSCVWRHICGGVDKSPRTLRTEHKMATDVWCTCQKTFLQHIVSECLRIRDRISKYKTSKDGLFN